MTDRVAPPGDGDDGRTTPPTTAWDDPWSRAASDAAASHLLRRTAPVVVGHVDRDERIRHVEGSLLATLGYDSDAWSGRQLADVVADATVLRLVRVGLRGQAGDDVTVLNGRPWLVVVQPVLAPPAGDAPADGTGDGEASGDVVGVVTVLTYADVVDVQRELTSSEALAQQLGALTELSRDFISLATLDGRLTYVNRAGRELVGLTSAEDAAGRPVQDFLTESARAELPRNRHRILTQGSIQIDTELRHFGTGEAIPTSMDAFLVTRESDGRHLGMATIQRDLRARVAAEAALAAQVDEQLGLAELGRTALTLSISDLLHATVALVCQKYAATSATVLRHTPDDCLVVAATSSDTTPATLAVDRTSVAGRALLDGAVTATVDAPAGEPGGSDQVGRPDGGDVLCAPITGEHTAWGVICCWSSDPRGWTDAERAYLASVASMVAAAVRRDELESRLQHQARHDPLTTLPNRLVALERIEDALSRAARRGTDVAVLLLDLDDFKAVNDTLGHVRGDELLAELAARLVAAVPRQATVARFGGDEFVVVVEDADDTAVAALGERLLEACTRGVAVGGLSLALSASLGVRVSRSGEGTATSLLSEADIAMYAAKRDRPGTYQVFDEAMREAVLDRLAIAGELRAAVQQDRIDVAYQPIVSVTSGQLVGMEALARWTGDDGVAVSPDVFIPVAEQTGLISDLGASVLRHAVAEAVSWQPLARGTAVRVNASAHQIRDPLFREQVLGILAQAGLAPELLGIEITESVFLDEDSVIQQCLTGLRGAGVTLLIDDFGTGYSSLSYLQRFPVVDVLKIDRSFLGEGTRGEAVVRAVVGLGQAFGLGVCAEGVETPDQHARVAALGCDLAQGWHFGRPVPAEEARRLVEHWVPVLPPD